MRAGDETSGADYHAAKGSVGMGHAPGQHLLRIFQHKMPIVWILGPVIEFIGIALQIEKNSWQAWKVDVFVPLAAHHRELALIQGKAKSALRLASDYIAEIVLPMGLLAPIRWRFAV